MTQNMRYCAGCGAARCGTCGRRPSSLRQDTANLARSTGGEAGAFFWGTIGGLTVLFWPTIFVHGPHRLPCEIGWYGFLVALVIYVVIAGMITTRPGPSPRRPRPKTGVPLTPSPSNGPWPDLRQSGEFTGKR